MSFLKKKCVCQLILIISSFSQLEAAEVVKKGMIRRFMPVNINFPLLNNVFDKKSLASNEFIMTSKRFYSWKQKWDSQEVASDLKLAHNQFKKYSTLLHQYGSMLQEIKSGIENFKKQNRQPVVQLLDSDMKRQWESQGEETSVQNDLINRIMICVKDDHKINPNEIGSIIDLYKSLILYPRDGITRVLTCLIDTTKSDIYQAAVAHIKSKGSDLDTYRKIYANLSEAFDENVMNVAFQTAEEMIRERRQINILAQIKKSKDINIQKCVTSIVEGSHPIYPVCSNEVHAILDLYVVLREFPRDCITRVLSGLIDTPKSTVYGKVAEHARQWGTNLETYRNIYARLKKTLNNKGSQIIYRIVDEKKLHGVNDLQEIVPGQPFLKKLGTGVSNVQIPQKTYVEFEGRSSSELVDGDVGNALEDSDARSFSNNFLSPEDGKYMDSNISIRRLNRIYDLLPEYHARNVTWVLSGKTNNQSLPIWKDVHDAIDHIRHEAMHEGEETIIDLDYFRKLYQSFSHDLKDIRYSISDKDKERLNRLYLLLSKYHARNVTWVLSGRTNNQSLPIWKDVYDAIDLIQQEAMRSGEKTKMDLKYFRKLYFKFVKTLPR